MLYKLRQQLVTHNQTPGNRTPNLRSRNFLINYIRQRRAKITSQGARAALGMLRWLKLKMARPRVDAAFRAECFITGRSRGTSQRFTVARTKVKELSGQAKLFGVMKASW